MRAALAVLLLASPAFAEDLATPADPVPQAAVPTFQGRKSVEEFWQSKGAPPHVAAGIADNVQRESGFNPGSLGDSGSSLGLYQAHASRMRDLLAAVANDQAWKDVTGRDPIASAHWQEILHAKDERTASLLWGRYFERCASCGGPNGRETIAAPSHTKRSSTDEQKHQAIEDPGYASAMHKLCQNAQAGTRVCANFGGTAAPLQRGYTTSYIKASPSFAASTPAPAASTPSLVSRPYTAQRVSLPQTSAVLALAQFFRKHR